MGKNLPPENGASRFMENVPKPVSLATFVESMGNTVTHRLAPMIRNGNNARGTSTQR